MHNQKIPKKLNILEICPFSAGICGVWARVLQESLEFTSLGHKVTVFSSDIVKGTGEKCGLDEEISGIKIKRFISNSSIISKNVSSFDFEKEFRKLMPDIVITHLLHPHSFKALELCRKCDIPCYLVTHAPFNVKRVFPLNLLTSIYNSIKVIPKINDFTKIIAITKWEMPYLEKLGAEKERIIYIPNGLPEEFFSQKKSAAEKGKDILFLGRIAPVKNLEIFIYAAEKLPDLQFSIVGSAENDYLIKLKSIIEIRKIKNITFYPPVYDLKKKIRLIDEHSIFVLPSIREAMPQVLPETMARAKIVVSSKTDGAKEIIQNEKTGFLFEIGDYEALAKIISGNISGNKKIQSNAEKEAKKYSWKDLIKKYPFIKQ